MENWRLLTSMTQPIAALSAFPAETAGLHMNPSHLFCSSRPCRNRQGKYGRHTITNCAQRPAHASFPNWTFHQLQSPIQAAAAKTNGQRQPADVTSSCAAIDCHKSIEQTASRHPSVLCNGESTPCQWASNILLTPAPLHQLQDFPVQTMLGWQVHGWQD